MADDEKVEIYVPNKLFDKSLSSEGLAKVISSAIEGCSMIWSVGGWGQKWEGIVDMGSGDIDIDVYGKSFEDIRVEMGYEECVVNRHKSRVRGVFGEIGLRKE